MVPAATSLDISFSGGGDGPAATIGKGSSKLALTWPAALPAPVLSGANATYPEVLPGVDLVLTAQAEGFAEILVVKTAAAAANPRLEAVRFGITRTRLGLRQDAAGSLTAVDGSGATLFGSGNPVMWDSAAPAGADAPRTARLKVPGKTRRAMPLQLSGDGLVIHPDVAMLRDKATKFPVYIDPALGKTAWTMINSNYPDQSYWSYDRQDCPSPYASIQCAKVGYTNVPTGMIYRSLFAFGISGLMHKHIQDAKLSMDTVYSWTNTDYGTQVRVAGGISSGTKWSNNAGSWGGVVATANSHAHDRVRRRTEWGVTGAVRTAAGGTSTTLTLGLRAVDETTVNQWKKFDAGTALLTVIYNSYPNAPGSLSVGGLPCVRGASRPYLRTLTPSVKARLSDPDGSARLLKGTFYWWPSGGSRTSANSVAQGSIVSGQYATATIPSGRLADGRIYLVQAIANDGIDSGQYSATCEFQVDVTAPGAPSGVTSATYPNDGQLHGGVGTAGSFVLKPPATVPSDFYGYAWSLDPGATPAAANQVTASSTDHTATISITPTADQTFNLRVWSRDKAGNFSAAYVYQFSVRAGTGPDARWTFDGQNGTDDSGHGNTVSLVSGSWTAGRGGYGKAFLLNGTSSYANTAGLPVTKDPNTGATISLHPNKSFTLAATVRLDTLEGDGQRAIVAEDGVHTSPFLLSYTSYTQKWRFVIAQDDSDAPTDVGIESDAVATTGVWTRLVATYDGTTHEMRLYVNGVLQKATAAATTFDSAGPLTIGRMKWRSGRNCFFPGAIDDVRVYGRVVGSAEHEFAQLAYPNPPLLSFPAGTSAYVGKPVQAVISAGGDKSVTKVKYQLGAAGTPTTVTLPTAGGQTTVTVTTTAVGQALLMANGIDAAGNASPIASAMLDFDEAPKLSGKVTDAITTAPLSGVTVLLSPGNLTATTDATGSYTFTGMNAGTYEVTATNGGNGCAGQIATSEVDIAHAVIIDLMLAPQADLFGYRCKVTPDTAFVAAPTKIALAGYSNQNSDPIGLPFPVSYYGKQYSRFWVSTTGVMTFVEPIFHIPYWEVSLPNQNAAPHGALFPFWDDLYVDTNAGIYTGLVGTGSAQRYVVEWRNVRTYSDPNLRLSFEVLISAGGDITFNYAGITADRTKGSAAAVGMTSPGGGYGLQYSFQEPALASGKAVTFSYPDDPWPIGNHSVSGNLTSGGTQAAGAVVELGGRKIWADDAGHYEVSDVEDGVYGVEAAHGCEVADEADFPVDSDVSLDMVLESKLSEDDGRYCAETDADWIPGVDEVQFSASDDRVYVPMPFDSPGGTGADSAGIQPNGQIQFAQGRNDVGGNIGVGGLPTFDDQSSVLTTTVGAAPNRRFVVEWRNVALKGLTEARGSYEMIIGEDGTQSVLFKDPPPPVKDPSWTDIFAFSYSPSGPAVEYEEESGHAFRTGRAVTFYTPVVG